MNYRECVVAVIVNDKGLVLCGMRTDRDGVWQLPQGGVDLGESPEEAVFRELSEEIGCADVVIRKVSKDRIKYDFPDYLDVPIAKKYKGQVQTWYLMELNEGAVPSLDQSDHEFQDLDWKEIDEIMENIVDWKRDAYALGFKSLNLIKE